VLVPGSALCEEKSGKALSDCSAVNFAVWCTHGCFFCYVDMIYRMSQRVPHEARWGTYLCVKPGLEETIRKAPGPGETETFTEAKYFPKFDSNGVDMVAGEVLTMLYDGVRRATAGRRASGRLPEVPYMARRDSTCRESKLIQGNWAVQVYGCDSPVTSSCQRRPLLVGWRRIPADSRESSSRRCCSLYN